MATTTRVWISPQAYERLHRPLTLAEQQDLYDVFYRVGLGLHVRELPASYAEWRIDRQLHLERDLVDSPHTAQLYEKYREHLGWWRYQLVLWLQAALVPERVRELLRLSLMPPLAPALRAYGVFGVGRLRRIAQWLLLPTDRLEEVRRLDNTGVA